MQPYNLRKRINILLMDFINPWLNKDKKKTACYTWIIFSIVLGIISSINTVTLTLDDTYLYQRFNDFEANKGFRKTIFTLFLNLDLASTGELRTYGVSKVIHFLLHHIARDNASVYQFIITTVHTLSGILIYKTLKRLKIAELPCILSAITFTLNPFNHLQTFHHWSYLMLPLYLVLLYCYLELGTIQKYENECKLTWRNYIFSFILIFMIVFTGEYTLPMLGCTVLFFIIYSIIKRNKKLVIFFIQHLVYEGVLVIGWSILWKKILSENSVGRFVVQKLNFNFFYNIFLSTKESFKRFLFIGSNNKLDMGKDGVFSLNMMILFITVIFIMLSIIYICFKEKITDYNHLVSWKTSIAITCFSLSSFAVYSLMSIIYNAGMSYRYFYSIFSLLTVTFIILFFSIFRNKKILYLLTICILVIFTGYNVIWYAFLKPTTANIDKEIVSKVTSAANNGKNTMIVITEDTVFGEVLLNSKCYRPLSVFSEAWASQTFFNNIFENVVYISPKDKIVDNLDNTVSIIGDDIILGNNYTTDTLTFNKQDIYIISNNRYTDERNYYTDVNDYLNYES
ncbi:hypothetical protein acsn021_09600 [Anaerocolumna cellulosilytica]|uniref:Uncharacterized protein n=1 Tax=Anaerocolumna cellulosilytica TaxID=433286 RepID=A0A6S6R2I2_9FIRM|nr:hypothetical protein [Anaerocolumna cellulosilytica]MBB5194446.1 hypothetical protein [Anaerocolumna cellulosilytica]BCJ93391.1 hypothetical protein acsn021_09600 [Anaerocolumna cellulosilytica]